MLNLELNLLNFDVKSNMTAMNNMSENMPGS